MSINKKLYDAIKISMLSRYAVYALSIITMMIMARLFTPQTFGTFAAISVFYIIFQLMTEAGLGPANIKVDNFGFEDLNVIFG